MIVFQAQKISKWFGERQVLKEISLAVNEKERVGLIGANGSGKTTFLGCLTGALQPDEGEVFKSASISLGCMDQLNDFPAGMTAWEGVMDSFTDLIQKRQQMRQLEQAMAHGENDLEHIMEEYARVTEEYEQANGYACETTARRILVGLGFSQEEFDKPLEQFSGGQKTRLNLGRLLALSPDILMLDEPTNHLDMNSVEWLEGFILNYPKTVLVVSHDRMFLDKVATRIAEIRNGKMQTYTGNYSEYVKKRAAEDLAQMRAYEKQQEHIEETEAYIRRFKVGIKSKQARGRQSQLERLERIDAPDKVHGLQAHTLNMNQQSGQDVLFIEDLSKAYGNQQLFREVNLQVKKGQKLALIGPNGSGKSTILKIITDRIPADTGVIRIGSRVEIAYFSQEFEDLNPEATVLDEVFRNFDMTLEQARTALGGMLFSEDDVYKLVGDLSGGERGRLGILKMLLSGANLLIMDEPTNHLDIDGREAVEQILALYEGTVLVVSHDRYFIDQVADGVLALEEGEVECYWGNYSYYHEKWLEKERTVEKAPEKKVAMQEQAEIKERQKEEQRFRRSLNKKIEECESLIHDLENRKQELENLLSDPDVYSDEEKSRSYNDEYRQIDQSLIDALNNWEELSEELIEFEEETQ
ncbi:MAG: ABC-F family ATP-binding cassette domain-containing protein [Bacillota bacterium]|nr:ABC-F family ATP-binding cassette domain-containing protein [Bacillota bacterium]